jgi:signal transduction histidine kinase
VVAALFPLATFAVNGWREQRRSPEVEGSQADGIERLRVLAQSVVPELQGSAMRMLEASIGTERGRRHTAIEGLLPRPALGEGAGVVMEGGRPIAWAGPIRVGLDSLTGDVGVVRTDFYTVAWARVARGTRSVIALRTLGASAPAGGLSRPFTRVAAEVAGFADVAVAVTPNDGVVLGWGDRPLAWLRPVEAERAVLGARRAAGARARVLLGVAGVLLVVLLGAGGGPWRRAVACGLALAVLPLAPLSTLSNVAPVFSAALYFSAAGGPWTASAGALGLAGALGTLFALVLIRQRRWRPGVMGGLVLSLVGVILTPLLVGYLAEGVSLPERGTDAAPWVSWSLALFLAACPPALITSWAGATVLGRRRWGGRWLVWTASLLAILGAGLTPMMWSVNGGMPPWWSALWFVALALLACSRWRPSLVVHTALVTGCGVISVVWVALTSQRIEIAERDVAGLTVPEVDAQQLLERLYLRAQRTSPASTRADLLKLYVGSELAAAGNPAELALWDNAGATTAPAAELVVAQLQRRAEGERSVVQEAATSGVPILRDVTSRQGTQLVMAAPLGGGRVLSAVVAPRNQLVGDDPFAALLGLDVPTSGEPPYRLGISSAGTRDEVAGSRWDRREDEWHRDWRIVSGTEDLFAHVEVELRPPDVLLARGTLLVLADVAVLGALWFLIGAGDRAMRRWGRQRLRRWWRSYRARLTLAIFGAFVIPSVAFGIWTLDRLAAEDLTSRSLLVQETLRAVRLSGPEALGSESQRLQTPLFWYDAGVLTATADDLHRELAPLGRYLDPVAADEVVFGREETANRRITLGAVPTLVGYRAMGGGAVLAAPARRSELTLDRQRGDVLALLLMALALGAGVAWGLSGLAALAFSQPIDALRRAADQVAQGARDLPALTRRPASEFAPVYSRFRAMAVELDDSRDALVAARLHTEAVLRDVASGVVAMDAAGRVVLANPQAEVFFGGALDTGHTLPDRENHPLGAWVAAFAKGGEGEAARDVTLRGRDVRARLTRLTRGDGGVVLTLDDVTELARAQRLLAWAEMARQVAHEIKNPLTPIRLGVQHLRRAHADGRPDFAGILDRNVERILSEIDRLDEIARSFSKFGLRPEDAAPTEEVDLERVAHDVADLERMGDTAIQWLVDVPGGLRVRAREGELREVLLNLLENSRHARATSVTVRAERRDGRVTLSVTDDGEGLSDEVLSRAFEPRFSTRTSGSGLGLAISRRLVESWGGKIDMRRAGTRGVVVTLTIDEGV